MHPYRAPTFETPTHKIDVSQIAWNALLVATSSVFVLPTLASDANAMIKIVCAAGWAGALVTVTIAQINRRRWHSVRFSLLVSIAISLYIAAVALSCGEALVHLSRSLLRSLT